MGWILEILEKMNESHEKLAQWGVNHLNIDDDEIILDISCGGGVKVKRFNERSPDGKVYGLDYSEVSPINQELNDFSIKKGKVEIIQGSVSGLVFEDEIFDLITGLETIYF